MQPIELSQKLLKELILIDDHYFLDMGSEYLYYLDKINNNERNYYIKHLCKVIRPYLLLLFTEKFHMQLWRELILAKEYKWAVKYMQKHNFKVPPKLRQFIDL